MWATSVKKDVGLGQRDVDNFSERWFDRISLEFTGFRVCGSRTLLGLRLLIRCLSLDQMWSLEFTGFRVAVRPRVW